MTYNLPKLTNLTGEHGNKSIQGIDPVIRVPWMVVLRKGRVRAERHELLVAGFMRSPESDII